MKRLESRKAELSNFLAEAQEPPPLPHPNMALQYRKRVKQFYDTPQDEDEGRGERLPGQVNQPQNRPKHPISAERVFERRGFKFPADKFVMNLQNLIA